MSFALDAASSRAPAGEDSLQSEYLRALRLIERLHRLLLDVIKDEFDRRGSADINSVQALLLYNMGDGELTAGELKTRSLVSAWLTAVTTGQISSPAESNKGSSLPVPS